MGLSVTHDAAVEPLSLTEARSWERVGHAASDNDLNALIKAARLRVEGDTSRALVNKTFTLTLDKVPTNNVITLPVGPVSSVTSIKSYSTSDVESTVSSAVYRVDASSVPGRIVLRDGQVWPTGLRAHNALAIVFVAGYGAAAANITDTPLIMAMRLLIEHWYANRGAVVVGAVSQEVALGYKYLIGDYIIRGAQ
jgi:uncharacterized phiE125 gp8 family phage protein